MPAYFSLGTKCSDFISDNYLHINNCGFCLDLTSTKVSRPRGRTDYQLIYVKSGQLEFSENGHPLLLSGGNVYLYRPGAPQHYRICGIETTFFWIHFTGTALPEILKGLPNGQIKTGELFPFESLCRSFYMSCQTSPHPNMLYYEGAFISLIAMIAEKAAGKSTSKIDAALLAINRDIGTRLSNEALAQLCGLSRFYFIKLFKSVTGQTPQQYYTHQALEAARGLLESTDYTIAQIASMCGFEDGFYFSRVFKKHTGISPAAYRKSQYPGFVEHGKIPSEKVDKSQKM